MRTALIDADIVAFQAAARHETWTDFGRTVGDEMEAREDIDSMLKGLCKLTKSDEMILALSCPVSNFRMDVLPTYKSNRVDKVDRRPVMLKAMKQYMINTYNTDVRVGLEGDDVMGILQGTMDNTIIISEDKDMRTIAGKLFAPHRQEVGEIDITKLQADQFLCWQTIVGDSTDGYKGAIGVGPKSLYALEVLVADADELWDIVLEAYGSVGDGETEALVQARCARILTADHFDSYTGLPILWKPEDML